MEIDILEHKSLINGNGVGDYCGIKANNDLSAVESWLIEYNNNKNTYSSYKREALKFLLWCKEVDKNFINLKKEDIHNYLNWLKNPPEQFIKDKDEDSSHQLKPFKGSQSFNLINYNIRVINSMLNYLVEAEYIHKNPIRLIKQFSKFKDSIDQELQIKSRILEDNEFQAVLETIEELPETNKKERDYKARAKIIFLLLYHLGLRVSELSNARWGNFKIVQGKCWFYLIGKGGKKGQIPVNSELLEILKKYREYLGLGLRIDGFEDDYILKSKKTSLNLSARRIREVVKGIFIKASDKFENPDVKFKLQNASPHDLRHLLASDLDKVGLSIIDTKEILRHSSEKTTEIYRNSKESERHNAIQDNKTGMVNLFSVLPNNFTKIKLEINCNVKNKLSFRYFIKSVRDIYLKKYKITSEKSLDIINQEFDFKSKTFSTLFFAYELKENLNKDELALLVNYIEEAASNRDIKVKVFVEN